MPVQMLNEITANEEQYYLPAEKLIDGNPLQQLWLEYSDPTGKFCSGVWQSAVGKWKIAYTEEEYCQILSGESIITDQFGVATSVRAGDRFVIPRGLVGSWEVVSATRKIFVIYEPGE